MTHEKLVPLAQVLDDMYGDKGPVSWAARDYYKAHYATEEERKALDREEKVGLIFSICVWGAALVGLISVILREVFA